MRSQSTIDAASLERQAVVANASMNRGRGLLGVDSYARELGFDLVEWLRARPEPRWIDLCCGSGRALEEAAEALPDASIEGIDLVGMFVPAGRARLQVGSVSEWRPASGFDLVTCVHGLHYVADKLRLMGVAASALRSNGLFIANLDLDNILVPGGRRALREALCARGFKYNARTHRVTFSRRTGPPVAPFSYAFLGSDPGAGPNYTMQPAVTSCYG